MTNNDESSSSSAARLLSVPTVAVAMTAALPPPGGSAFWRYTFVLLILGFLGLTLYLYLEKPVGNSITTLYDPVTTYLTTTFRGPTAKNKAAVHKLEEVLDEKSVVNKIDTGEETTGEETIGEEEQEKREFKKPPVIPQPDESVSSLPTSKAGYCYIGEDRGFRSCIKVGEGDVCMSGDIFPTREVCINPNLRT